MTFSFTKKKRNDYFTFSWHTKIRGFLNTTENRYFIILYMFLLLFFVGK